MIQKLDDIPPKKINDVLPHKDYEDKDVKDAAELITQMLRWVPDDRISCKKALDHEFFKEKKTS